MFLYEIIYMQERKVCSVVLETARHETYFKDIYEKVSKSF